MNDNLKNIRKQSSDAQNLLNREENSFSSISIVPTIRNNEVRIM